MLWLQNFSLSNFTKKLLKNDHDAILSCCKIVPQIYNMIHFSYASQTWHNNGTALIINSQTLFFYITFFGYDVGVPRSLRTRHIQHPRDTQFYAPTLASKKEFRLFLFLILRLFALNKGVGH